jgi:hypothetical protein
MQGFNGTMVKKRIKLYRSQVIGDGGGEDGRGRGGERGNGRTHNSVSLNANLRVNQ